MNNIVDNADLYMGLKVFKRTNTVTKPNTDIKLSVLSFVFMKDKEIVSTLDAVTDNTNIQDIVVRIAFSPKEEIYLSYMLVFYLLNFTVDSSYKIQPKGMGKQTKKKLMKLYHTKAQQNLIMEKLKNVPPLDLKDRKIDLNDYKLITEDYILKQKLKLYRQRFRIFKDTLYGLSNDNNKIKKRNAELEKINRIAIIHEDLKNLKGLGKGIEEDELTKELYEDMLAMASRIIQNRKIKNQAIEQINNTPGARQLKLYQTDPKEIEEDLDEVYKDEHTRKEMYDLAERIIHARKKKNKRIAVLNAERKLNKIEYFELDPNRIKEKLVLDQQRLTNPIYGYFKNVEFDKYDYNEFLSRCSMYVKDIQVEKFEENQGYEGEVLFGTGKSMDDEEINVAIKVSPIDPVMYDDSFKTIHYTYFVNRINYGPELYDAFYYANSKGMFQVLIMEKCEHDLWNMDPKDTTIDMLHQVSEIVWDLLMEFNILCFDIKPNNFVYCASDERVKIIDLSSMWCSTDEYSEEDKEWIYVALMVMFLTYNSAYEVSQKAEGKHAKLFENHVKQFIGEDDSLNKLNQDTYLSELYTHINKLSKDTDVLTLKWIFLKYVSSNAYEEYDPEFDLNQLTSKIKKDLQLN
jgi:hypothetical protein